MACKENVLCAYDSLIETAKRLDKMEEEDDTEGDDEDILNQINHCSGASSSFCDSH